MQLPHPLARAFSSCLFRFAMPLFNKKGIFFFEKLPKKNNFVVKK